MRSLFTSCAVLRPLSTGLLLSLGLASGLQAQEKVATLHSARQQVFQVIVGDQGQSYLMSTLQIPNHDEVLVTNAMARSAQPVTVEQHRFTPITSLDQVPNSLPPDSAPRVSTGVRQIQSVFINPVYEVIYQDGDRLMQVETIEAPQDGYLLLTEELRQKSKAL